MNFTSNRLICLYGFILIAILLIGTFYLQYFQGINPCPLCVLQRITIAIIGSIFFIGAVFRFQRCGKIVIGVLASLFSLLGIFFAGRQVWLQHLPPNKNLDCGASLEYMLHVLPLDQVFKKVLQGSAECSEVGWQFLYISLAGWSLIFFIVLLLISLFQLKCLVNCNDK